MIIPNIRRKEMLRNLFCKTRSAPISYAEFSTIGMSTAEYVTYVAKCDHLRSVLMAFEDMKKKFNKADAICESCLDDLLTLLQHYCNPDFDFIKLFHEHCNFKQLKSILHYYYNFSEEMTVVDKEDSSISFEGLYMDFDNFRIMLENRISSIINSSYSTDVFDEFSVNLEDLSISELKLISHKRKNYIENNFMPNFPDRSGWSYNIYEWAENYSKYCSKEDYIEQFQSVDNIIRYKEIPEFDVTKHTLYIYPQSLPCVSLEHNYESVTATINLYGNSNKIATLDIVYCHECKKFYIDETSYNLYRSVYKFLPVCFEYISSPELASDRFANFALKSPLMLCGYSVDQRVGLSRDTRRDMLARIIDNNIHNLSKYDIIQHLEMLIRMNENNPNMVNAESKWKEDLMYVHNYKMSKQTNVEINHITHY